jgi:N-acetylglucosamine-6-sulfatase
MKPRLISVLTIAVVCLVMSPGVRAAEAKRPNIVFILADDLRYDALGCTGNPHVRTPHIDRLAAEGLLFKNFFVATPLCSPSRASFLTGLYPHAHRVINNDKLGLDVISHTLYTFPRMLREAGYETAFIGKWHMGLDDTRRPGFDLWISFKGQGLYLDPVVNIDGIPRQLDGYMTDHLNRWAVEFVEKSHTKPFALVLAHKGVHAPFIPAPRHEHLYGDVRPVVPPNARDDLEGKPAMTRKLERIDPFELEGVAPEPAEPSRGRRTGDPAEVVRNQMRCLASVDEGVGQLLDALKRRGLLDETVVIVTADNGYLHGEHGLYNTKYWPYEESIRVPFVVRYPPLFRPGTVREELLLNVDLAPTLLDLAGVEPRVKFHGRSFVPLLGEPSGSWRTAILAEFFPEKVNPRVPAWQAVRTERWKYIHYPRLEGMDEIYDLAADPGELSNRIGDPGAAVPLEQLQGSLKSLLEASR